MSAPGSKEAQAICAGSGELPEELQEENSQGNELYREMVALIESTSHKGRGLSFFEVIGCLEAVKSLCIENYTAQRRGAIGGCDE